MTQCQEGEIASLLAVARNGNNVQKVLVIFISGTDGNTIESRLSDDAAPDLDAVGTSVSVERSILRAHWSI